MKPQCLGCPLAGVDQTFSRVPAAVRFSECQAQNPEPTQCVTFPATRNREIIWRNRGIFCRDQGIWARKKRSGRSHAAGPNRALDSTDAEFASLGSAVRHRRRQGQGPTCSTSPALATAATQSRLARRATASSRSAAASRSRAGRTRAARRRGSRLLRHTAGRRVARRWADRRRTNASEATSPAGPKY